jgi:RNA polymerase sigma-70 factor (ECF subfamily)
VEGITVLALRAKAGDRRALEDFVAATQPGVWRLCRFLGSPTDPDDLTQETFERALQSLHRFRGDGDARSWILAIARRVCVDATRRSVRQRRLADRLIAATLAESHRDAHWLEVEELLAALDEERREAFVLTQFVGLSYEEAAEVAGVPVGTIRSRVSRARNQLLDQHARDRAATA